SFDPQAALAEDPAQTAIRELNLSLDVAQVERAEQPFVLLREVIRHLAQTMEGLIIDDDGQPLAEAAMDQIAFELENLYDNLDARELSAGSALARRLFS
ncbi:MAG: cell division protein FtsZ, partial [Hylemonella sp.]|nr:cell division protein FtsZ [Hylemonella sp.]